VFESNACGEKSPPGADSFTNKRKTASFLGRTLRYTVPYPPQWPTNFHGGEKLTQTLVAIGVSQSANTSICGKPDLMHQTLLQKIAH
jgi:hypothetical protein